MQHSEAGKAGWVDNDGRRLFKYRREPWKWASEVIYCQIKTYVKIEMKQITHLLYEFKRDWEHNDFELSEETEGLESGSGITEDHLEAVERKKLNATQPFTIHTVRRYFLR